MNDFERGFYDELQKIAALGLPSMKGMASSLSKGIGKGIGAAAGGATKGFASAMRSPLSLITAMKPPKQEFFKGI